ncbi:MAG: methylated-DNA--[protein]-cysteine S-methyltransferase [Propionibacteriaceae bacterium]|nr:methylated-DNA--[protein]-cysteine S-methyltransferase [Propionibacteriaceae bacterium]
MRTTLGTVDGPFTIVATGEAVIASGWTDDVDRLLEFVHPSLLASDDVAQGGHNLVIDQAVQALHAYYEGDFEPILKVPVSQVATGFRERAWKALREVPAGHRVTYAELATNAGNPGAARAAGSACSHNAVPLFVPCHRVVASGGGLGGFAYGLDLKRRLLDREKG